MSRFFALIPAAGVGVRAGASIPKQYVPIAGKAMLQHVLESFAGTESIAHTFVLVAPQDRWIEPLLLSSSALTNRVTVIQSAGAKRCDTVRNGLAAIASRVDLHDWILVHDAARPGLRPAMIQRLIDLLRDDPVGGLLALPVADTLKRADHEHRIDHTVAREGLWLAQTPQMFRYQLLRDALAQQMLFTDEASAVEAQGLHPKLVMGHAQNFKVTLSDDFTLASLYLKYSSMDEPCP